MSITPQPFFRATPEETLRAFGAPFTIHEVETLRLVVSAFLDGSAGRGVPPGGLVCSARLGRVEPLL